MFIKHGCETLWETWGIVYQSIFLQIYSSDWEEEPSDEKCECLTALVTGYECQTHVLPGKLLFLPM